MHFSKDLKNWYALYTLPKKEKFIKRILDDKNVETFLPTHKVVRQWSDRRKEVELPLFFNYLFVKIRKCDKCRVLDVPGVVNIVGNKMESYVVPDNEIDGIKNILHYKDLEVKPGGYMPGDELIILSGPFAGLKGVVTKSSGMSRVAVFISCINRSVILTMDSSLIQAKTP